jgi:ectoine hydroxylase-related dioxygenase (phytanoyl-CoA dioxygenase family)
MHLLYPMSTAALLDIDTHHPLTDDQIARFRRDGYVKLKHVLSPEVIEHYGKVITAEVHRLNTMHLPLEQRDTYSKAFLQVMNIWTKNDTVKEFCFGKKLARMAAELMGVKGVRLYHDQALYKEPAGGITPWHADQYYWPLSSPNTVTVWIPLQATPMELGPLGFSIGSHRFEAGRELGISDESEKVISRSLKDHNYPLDETPFDLGEVSFHYGWTFHRAGPNTSNRPRAVMTIIYMEDGIRLIAPKHKNHQLDWDTWMPGVKIGEPAASPLNPLVYSA